MSEELFDVIRKLPLEKVEKIDAGLEANWNATVTTLWTKNDGFLGFDKLEKEHSENKHCVELHFDNGCWFGFLCSDRINDKYVFNEKLVLEIIEMVKR